MDSGSGERAAEKAARAVLMAAWERPQMSEEAKLAAWEAWVATLQGSNTGAAWEATPVTPKFSNTRRPLASTRSS